MFWCPCGRGKLGGSLESCGGLWLWEWGPAQGLGVLRDILISRVYCGGS